MLDKRRPAVLFPQQKAHDVCSFAVGAPVSSAARGPCVAVTVGQRDGLTRQGGANCDWLANVPRSPLAERIGGQSPKRLRQPDRALRCAIGLNEVRGWLPFHGHGTAQPRSQARAICLQVFLQICACDRSWLP